MVVDQLYAVFPAAGGEPGIFKITAPYFHGTVFFIVSGNTAKLVKAGREAAIVKLHVMCNQPLFLNEMFPVFIAFGKTGGIFGVFRGNIVNFSKIFTDIIIGRLYKA